jgi:hypothetical protein
MNQCFHCRKELDSFARLYCDDCREKIAEKHGITLKSMQPKKSIDANETMRREGAQA